MPGETSTLNGYLLWQAANLWQKEIRGVLAPFDVTPVQFLLLSGLHEIDPSNGAPVKQAALARHCDCDPMMTSQVLRALEKTGLIRRTAHKKDRRAHAIAITEAGRGVVRTLRTWLARAAQTKLARRGQAVSLRFSPDVSTSRARGPDSRTASDNLRLPHHLPLWQFHALSAMT